jgi:hypothetical protein
MRTKGNYHAKNYKTFKLLMHLYFTKGVSHYLPNTRSSRTKPKQKANTTLRGKFAPRNHMFKATIMYQNSKFKTTSKLHKNVNKSEQKQEYILHVLGNEFSTCNCLPKDNLQTPKLFTRRIHKIFKDFYKFFSNILTKKELTKYIFPHVFNQRFNAQESSRNIKKQQKPIAIFLKFYHKKKTCGGCKQQEITRVRWKGGVHIAEL